MMESRDPIEVANAKSLEEFSQDYLPDFDVTRRVFFPFDFHSSGKSVFRGVKVQGRNDGWWPDSSIDLRVYIAGPLTPGPSTPPATRWTHPKCQSQHIISLQTAAQVSQADHVACFELHRSSSMEDYRQSRDGWNPRAKRAEMRLRDLKYFLVKDEAVVRGFASVMPTYEDEHAVVYCYEIHLDPSLQGTGLGSLLMRHVRTIAENIPTVGKIMLTCFTRNTRAMRFYRKVGFETDAFSPEPKLLMNGRCVEAAYVILSMEV